MSTAATDTGVFRFFSLPAEVRNIVYAFATHDVPGHKLKLPAIWVDIIQNFPVTNLQLVSQQFKKEYESEVERNIQIDLEVTHDSRRYSKEPPKSQASFRRHLAKAKTVVLYFPAWTYPMLMHGRRREEGESRRVRHAEYTPIDLTDLPPDSSAAARSALQIHFAHMTGLRTLIIRHRISTSSYEEEYSKGMSRFLGALKQYYVPSTSTFDVQAEFLLHANLWAPHSSLLKGYERLPIFHMENWIVYRGTPSPHPHAWCGLDLEVVKAGIFSEEAMQEELAQSLQSLGSN